MMRVLHATGPGDYRALDTAELTDRFVVDDLFSPGELAFTYLHDDRMVVGGISPSAGTSMTLPSFDPLRSAYFCERRELAVVALSSGVVHVDDAVFELDQDDVLYVGRGSREVRFEAPAASDSVFYLVSAPAHDSHPTTLVRRADAAMVQTGSVGGANARSVYRYIHADGARSCQLVVGITALEPGSVWNSMPPHLHDRRTEVYLYKDLAADERVMHVMGEPAHTRHMMLANLSLVVAPSWSVHFGAGNANYSFVWAMAGENQVFEDMEQVAVVELG